MGTLNRYRLPDTIGHRLATSLVTAFLLSAGPSPAKAQDVYLIEWTIQDPQSALLQVIASRTLEAVNLWLTRDNVAAETARLDDPLRITIIGRYQPRTGKIVEDLVRIRAGTILVEDEPSLFLPRGLIDTLLRREYFWQAERVDVVDRSLAPTYLVDRPTSNSGSIRNDRITPPDVPSDLNPLLLAITPEGWKGFADVGNPIAELPGFSYGRARIGAGRGGGELWVEAPLNVFSDGILGPGGRATWGVGGRLRLDWATLSTSVGFFSEPDTSLASDTVRLTTHITAFGTLSTSTPIIDGLYGSLDLGGSMFEAGFRSPTVNDIPTERSEIALRPYLRIRLYPGARDEDRRLQLLALQTSVSSLQVSGAIRLLPALDLQFGGVVHGLVGERIAFQPETTIWVAPVFRIRL